MKRYLLFLSALVFPFLAKADNHQLNKNGKLEISIYTNDNHDIISNSEGTEHVIIPKGIIQRKSSFTAPNGQVGEKYPAIFDMKIADKLYTFLSNHSEVEFGLSIFLFTNTVQTKAFISTSFQKRTNWGNLAVEGFFLKEVSDSKLILSMHSHPNIGISKSMPSGFDKTGTLSHFYGDNKYYFSLKNSYIDKVPDYFFMWDCNSKRTYAYNDVRTFRKKEKSTLKIIRSLINDALNELARNSKVKNIKN